ncbi:uncharacterized protein B0I36DRAFT_360621 [Microdochium trichocladiopsis]|uniref:dihydroneopterin aldolase n=1 Tax=Microdochium trichocladiopsis TaxID=1682393 RepID=A0A9P9BWM2_9PEZI|nr:uncharacterized protein B0I36DRAFT_360621 [Microdochium trichocladiopsis]KAH7035221.1 hypothetical protein B0I36DRAFT_360621 [Microdochium trichocladiopsis]
MDNPNNSNIIIPKLTAEGDDPAAPLQSTFQVRAQAGEPVAVVRVRNLQATIPCGRDAWGRSGKVQPVLLSSELSFRAGFDASSAGDRLVDSETVHYGNLSKTLLRGLEGLNGGGGGGGGIASSSSQPAAAATNSTASSSSSSSHSPSSSAIFELLWVRLTGRVTDGSQVALPPDQVPFLDASALRSLSLTIHLPKASLLGAGVSLTTTASFKDRDTLLGGGDDGDDDNDDDDDDKKKKKKQKKNPLAAYARSLRISGLHVPTLVGVNANERLARQMLVAEVEIDRFDVTGDDVHDQIERVVVDAMEKSSFETLEALGTHIATKILDEFRLDPSRRGPDSHDKDDNNNDNRSMRERGWQVRVCLEKPIAVPFAECPAVEVRMGSGL